MQKLKLFGTTCPRRPVPPPHKRRHSESNGVFSFDEESVKASHFVLLKRHQYLFILTHRLNWIVEFAMKVGFY